MSKVKNIIYIQGECESIKSSLKRVGLLAEDKPSFDFDFTSKGNLYQEDDNDILSVGIYDVQSDMSDHGIQINTDFICLIRTEIDKADEMLHDYGGYKNN